MFSRAGNYELKEKEAKARGNMLPLPSVNINLFNHGLTVKIIFLLQHVRSEMLYLISETLRGMKDKYFIFQNCPQENMWV